MLLNYLWVGFFLTAFLSGLVQWMWLGDAEIFARLMQAVFDSAKAAFEISLGLTGALAFWLGILRVGERGGFLRLLTRGLTPLLRRLMPQVPPDHPAMGAMVMNLSANLLGLDNAATPLGIKAMQELQSLNRQPDTATNAQILFFVINASSITLFPVSILVFRAQMGAAHPADVFIPIVMATFCSTFAGFASVALRQRIDLRDPVILIYLAGFMLAVAGLTFYFGGMNQDDMQRNSAAFSNLLLFSLIALFLAGAIYRRVNAYEAFIEGAKEGFHTAITILPYLVAMLVAIGVLRASGLLEAIMSGMRSLCYLIQVDARFVDALPTALIKPFSGSGARAMMLDSMRTYGVDSFPARLATIIQGSTETTFYVLAVYFGAVGVKNVRYAVGCGLLADLAGVLAAIVITYRFYG
ncbi:nucleoside recognition domain-containing protein [Methylocaldum sp.]|uniref:nucleoside recognition domain-containing protein n=1 Tax=Methylocaldum sp. TaxID=1969727 RepID=UPI002D699EC9|nr:nucleoside recognition domain-containing protein [Methylocaldum sp.]HYE37332.1 nucleoside recognition domain-containing protein [Methylocaldum sp.]